MTLIRLAVLMASMVWQVSPIEQALAGSWTGTLQYRDYQSDRLVTLPTKLEIVGAGAGELTFSYTYDDGPGKIVRSQDRVRLDVAAATYRVQSGDFDATFRLEGLDRFSRDAGTFVLLGTGDENGAPVDLRISYAISSSSLIMRRESRRANEEWRFRNEYRLTR